MAAKTAKEVPGVPSWRQPRFDPSDAVFWFRCSECGTRLNIKEVRNVRLSRVALATLCPDCAASLPGPCALCLRQCEPGERRLPQHEQDIDAGLCPRCLEVVEGRVALSFAPAARPSALAERRRCP